jgi:hypothetical protein
MEKSNKIFCLQIDFKKVLKQCEGHNDDRQLFINCYNNLVDATKEFENLTISNPLIHVAFNNQFKKEEEQLHKQVQSLAKRNMINL